MRPLLIMAILLVFSPAMRADFVNGSTTCPTSGSKQVSATSYALYQLSVTMPTANTGSIAIGGSGVTTSNAPLLAAGYSANWSKPNAGINPTSLYFACTVNTDTIQWVGSR